MASRANWAKMRVATGGGGTGTLTLEAVSGFPTFTQAFGSGSTSVAYVANGTDVREAGEGTFNGTALTIASRAVTQSWNGTTYGTSALDIPVGAEVYCDLIAQTTVTSDGNVELPGTLVEDATLPAEALAAGVLQTTEELQDSLGVPNTSGKRCELVYQFKGIANSTQVLDPKATFPYTIAKLNHEGSEALTANVRIASTSVTGLSAVAVTTSNADSTATAANVVVAGDRVTVIFTDIATTADVTLKLVVDRD